MRDNDTCISMLSTKNYIRDYINLIKNGDGKK